MAKRVDPITLGSGKFYMALFEDAMPTKETLFVESNRVGYIKGGATLEYTEETYEEKDDLGYKSKIVTVSEEAIFKCGLLSWNGDDLQKLIDRCKVTVANGLRTVKIGGAGNAQGKHYAIGFWHEDEEDGDVWIMLKGRNSKGLSMAFATESGTVIEPEFRALPHDSDGTLVEFIEETDEAA
jgi:hypothetical protein